jgi:hypothetical protein
MPRKQRWRCEQSSLINQTPEIYFLLDKALVDTIVPTLPRRFKLPTSPLRFKLSKLPQASREAMSGKP